MAIGGPEISGGELRLWAKSTRCAPSGGGGCTVDCKPFLLNGAVLQRWMELLRSAQSLAPTGS